ncbi:hypothetical protein BC936DRAFT_144775 [Jimgerdemannia flammicorona]|uniref:Uncharacterized protein n=1 Tax=Jimgerdemannia flammicorona TaxID=994334 RepID=A0A433DBR4_9FUNG|nr:hypothetical protein BC936DRAFT_144775 [Jimgerdemannia flammicorona]
MCDCISFFKIDCDEPPTDIHPALAAININDWSYQLFVQQIIIQKIPVESVGDVERLWLDLLDDLSSRKEISRGYRSIIKRLREYQPLEQLESATERAIQSYVSQSIRYRIDTVATDIQKSTEEQKRRFLVSRHVEGFLDSDNRKADVLAEGSKKSSLYGSKGFDSDRDVVEDYGFEDDEGIDVELNHNENEGDEDSDEDYEDVEGTSRISRTPLTDISRREYKAMFESMDDSSKWKLKSGRKVEDILYNSVHSFIIDLKDQQICALFTDEEREELECTNSMDDIVLDNDTEKCIEVLSRPVLVKFVTRLANLRDDEIDMICYAVQNLVHLYERQPNPLCMNHLEAWYNLNIWGPTIDKVFGDIRGIDVARGESCSISSSNRKNKSRKQDHTERKVIGRRGDAIRKSTSGRALEFGAAEVGRYYHGENGTKWLAESGLKLPKMLRDMLFDL